MAFIVPNTIESLGRRHAGDMPLARYVGVSPRVAHR
jgi:hypothetical protein